MLGDPSILLLAVVSMCVCVCVNKKVIFLFHLVTQRSK